MAHLLPPRAALLNRPLRQLLACCGDAGADAGHAAATVVVADGAVADAVGAVAVDVAAAGDGGVAVAAAFAVENAETVAASAYSGCVVAVGKR